MKILIICSGNAENFDFKIHQAFIYEQIEAAKKYYNVEYETFFINSKGFWGYLKAIPEIRNKIIQFSPDLIHAHFGLSGFASSLQRKVPTITTFHGSDGYIPFVRMISKIATHLSIFNIFVEQKLHNRISINKKKSSVIPCGVDFNMFSLLNKNYARDQLNLEKDKEIILFASSFNNPVKNYTLAKEALNLIDDNLTIIELNNKTRKEVNLLLNSCDILLLTSFSEGSPQIIKEAMACNCPIVSTDVGDVKEVIGNTEGCYITSFDAEDVADKIKKALKFGKRTNGREKIRHLDNKVIAKKIYDVYSQVTR